MNYTAVLQGLRDDIKSMTKILIGGNDAHTSGVVEMVHTNTENIARLEKVVEKQSSSISRLADTMAHHSRVSERTEEKIFRTIANNKKEIESIQDLATIDIDKVGWFLRFIALRKTSPKFFWAVVVAGAVAIQTFPWWLISAALLKRFLGIELVLILQNIAR